MLFTSYSFLFLFLPVFLLVYLCIPERRRAFPLLVAGYLFYGWWRFDFCLLLAAVTTVGYVGGRWISADRSQARVALVSTLTLLLVSLTWFKYAGFLGRSWNGFSSFVGIPELALPVPELVLPIGISFFTFHTLSYVVDVYRGMKACDSWVRFAAYVALFPQLVAGPIVRYSDVAKDLVAPRVTWSGLDAGMVLFMLGFCKKVWLANNLAPGAEWAFSLIEPDFYAAWLGLFCYTLQIYFDFSGYSDMALGLGLVIGFHFPENFRRPYLATSITDFWQRWHISMSSFFRDYLYIPLGGNRCGAWRTQINLIATMLLAGLWHGASWNFVLWGGLHGCMLAVHRVWSVSALSSQISHWQFSSRLANLLTLLSVMFCWVFFRADTFKSAMVMIQSMLGLGGTSNQFMLRDRFDIVFWTALGVSIVYVFSEEKLGKDVMKKNWVRWSIAIVFVAAIHELGCQAYNPFLYFQF